MSILRHPYQSITQHEPFFLEDNAQEQIVPELFCRIAHEQGVARERLDVKVPYSRGGGSIKAMRKYLEDYPDLTAAAVVLGSDGNCKGFAEKRKMLYKNCQDLQKSASIIFAIPDPHIERWYLLDANALSAAVGERVADHAPARKCAKDYYKCLLRDAIFGAGVIPLQGGAEYGVEIARVLDLYKASKGEPGLKAFVTSVQRWAKAVLGS